MAKPARDADQAMEAVVSMAKRGHLIQQLSPYHFRIVFRPDLFVDWWPTTLTARLNLGQGGDTIHHADDSVVRHLLEGLHYAVFGHRPQPVLANPRQSKRDPEKREEADRRTRARRPRPEGEDGQAQIRDESSPPWNE